MRDLKIKKQAGSTHSNGKTALSFKKGTKNFTEHTVEKTSGKLRTEMPASPKKKAIPGNQQERGPNESIPAYYSRRNANRAKNKK